MIGLRNLAIAGVATIALAAAPIHSANARWHGGGPIFWPFALGAAVVTGAAIVATAPFRYAAPVYAPAYYPQQGYYAPPPGYYYGR